VKAFKEYREGASFISRVTREILSAMCEAEGLSTFGPKIDLLARLKKWVCRPKIKTDIYLRGWSCLAWAEHPPPTSNDNGRTFTSWGGIRTGCYGKGLGRHEVDRTSFVDEPRTFQLGDSHQGEANCRPVDGYLHGPLACHPYQALG
jgi:hypothetical protein